MRNSLVQNNIRFFCVSSCFFLAYNILIPSGRKTVCMVGTKITDETTKPGMEEPLHYWTPSIAPSGMEFISSDKYKGWENNLLVGSLKFQYLDNCYIKDGKVIKEERLLDGLGRVRSINQGPDGYIYVGIENLGIVKLIKTK